MSKLEDAKSILLIPALWERRGWPGEPGKECLRPYAADDRRKSGSVHAEGRLFKDFKTGENFDAPGLLAQVEGMSVSSACKLFIELAGLRPGEHTRARQVKPMTVNRSPEVRKKPILPNLRPLESSEIDLIAEARELSPRAIAVAAERELVFGCEWKGVRSWAVTDSSRWNAQFRRLDGLPFETRNGAVKTLGVSGGWGSWPIGCADLEAFENVILVEGNGDFLAAHHFAALENVIDKTAAVCLTGASVWIPTEALGLFRGRRVRIFPHLDRSGAGEEGALRWETQLRHAGVARVECFDLTGLKTADGQGVEDLNDLARVSRDQLPRLAGVTKL